MPWESFSRFDRPGIGFMTGTDSVLCDEEDTVVAVASEIYKIKANCEIGDYLTCLAHKKLQMLTVSSNFYRRLVTACPVSRSTRKYKLQNLFRKQHGTGQTSNWIFLLLKKIPRSTCRHRPRAPEPKRRKVENLLYDTMLRALWRSIICLDLYESFDVAYKTLVMVCSSMSSHALV